MKAFIRAGYTTVMLLLSQMACLSDCEWDYVPFSWQPASKCSSYMLGYSSYYVDNKSGQVTPGSTYVGSVDANGVWQGTGSTPPEQMLVRAYDCYDPTHTHWDDFHYKFFAYTPGNNFTNITYLDYYNTNAEVLGGCTPMAAPPDYSEGAPSANSPFNDRLGIPLWLLTDLGTPPWLANQEGFLPPGNPDNNSPNSPCGGMPVWSVSEPSISLWLRDEPLGYQPAIGPRISFELAFKQRENAIGLDQNIFSVGRRWNCSWLSYVSQDPFTSNFMVNFPRGGQVTYTTTNDYQTGTILAGDTTNGFVVTYPDGSEDIYGFIVTNVYVGTSTNFSKAFLTEHLNPQSQKTTFIYFPYNNAAPVIRLEYVIDGDGRTNTIYYGVNNAFSTNLISRVVDPFGRTALLAYDSNGNLTNITDVATNSSSMDYDVNSWVTNLITPYGTNSFVIADTPQFDSPPNGRSVLVTQPDGGHQLYLYEDNAPGISNTFPANVIPDTVPFANTFETNNLNYRNSFHWGPRQYANLHTTIISNFDSQDFLLARMKHWLLSSFTSLSQTLALERDPSPDSGGTTEGQLSWYDYAGKVNASYIGTQAEPSLIAQVLPDGTTRFIRSLRNDLGATTNEISTYSVNGTVLFRTNIYVYAANQIDLLVATNALGLQVSSNAYNIYHEVTNSYDALDEQTVYTYNANQQLASTILPTGLVTTNIYGPDNFLATQIATDSHSAIDYATNNYTYTNDLVFTHTDPRGLTVTNTWDNLNRLVDTAFPDGTSVKNTYSKLDLVQTVDRMGLTNSFGYDSMQRMIASTNALGAVTIYNYCTCGALESVQNAATNLTQYFYDNEGNETEVLYADNYSVTNTYNLLQQLVSTVDSGGNSITNTYNNQGLLTTVSNAFGQVQSTAYDVLDRVTDTVDANGVSVATTYDSLNRPLSRSYPDNGVEHWGYTPDISGATSYTNQIGNVSTYAYDALGRQTNNAVLGVTTNSFTYDGAGDRLTITDGKNQTTTWTYDLYGNASNKVDAASNLIFVYHYDADNRLTNRWSAAKGTTVYRYDNGGNLTNIDYSGGTVSTPSIFLAYDVLNRLTNMVDAVGDTAYSYDSVGELLSENGPWANDTVSYTYENRLRTGMSLSQTSGSWSQSYGYDVSRRMTNVTSQAGSFGYQYAGSGPSTLVSRLALPNGASITNSYDNVARLLSTKLVNSSSSVLDSESYGYSLAGQRIAETNTAFDYRNYGYDNGGELTSAIGREWGGGSRWQEQLGYTYDAAGNLNYRTNNALVQTFNLNNLNELTTLTHSGALTVAGTTTTPATSVTVNTSNAILYADNTFASTNQPITNAAWNTYTAVGQDTYGRTSTNSVKVFLPAFAHYDYDLNGNLLDERSAAGGTNRFFVYDDENQLISVLETNVWRCDFVYDGKFRRRIEKDYAWQGGTWVQTNETHFIYDGNVVIQERDANNNPLITYTRSGNSLLARTDYGQEIPGGPTTAYYHEDGNANVTMLIYSNQIIAAEYLYDPFGNTLSASGPLATLNVYRFASKEWNSSAGLYYFVRRYYDPLLQRFINRDPIAEQGGINLYAYVANNSINLIDPMGLWPCWLQNLWNALIGTDNPDDNTVGNLFPNYNPYDPNTLFNPFDLNNNQTPFSLGTDQTGLKYEDTATTLNLLGLAQSGAEYGSGTAVVGLYTDAATSSGLYFNSTFWGGNKYVTTMRISELAHAAGPILFGATAINDVYGAATHQVSPLEAGRDIDAGFIGLVGGPPGAAIGITYSLFHQDINSTAAGGFQILTDWYYNAPLGPNFADQPGSP